ncbi:TIM-barrel domain-containing protein [Alicyclobacillus herbarius]|uniref:glycoside hydrolase family 31 protein n=1 Tax=Alicyclobacillus herbarius TaxID=122960 RepID=UPI0023540333|nr:TIM-barrel domain-containing protein [Alicyclobacillus herbarius]
MLRICATLDSTIDLSTTPAVVHALESEQLVIDSQGPAGSTIASEELSLRFGEDGLMVLCDVDGEPIVRFQYYRKGDKLGLIVPLAKMDRCYGLGEETGFLDKRGERYVMWNSDVYSPHVPEMESLYVSVPLLLVLTSHRAFGLFVDEPGRLVFDMRSDPDQCQIEADGSRLDAYFFTGPSLKEVISQYTHLTGRMPLPPKWALGYHQSRYSYMTEDEVLEIARTFREKKIPLAAIHLDIHYMDGYRVFTFDGDRFPHPERMTEELLRMGVRTVTIVDPGVKRDPEYWVYREGLDNDRFCCTSEGEPFLGEVWPGVSAFPDFTDEKVVAWWADLHRFYVERGVRGIWNDMNEPAVFNQTKTMDMTVVHRNNGNPVSHGQLHNLYGFLMAKASYLGMKKLLAGERPFVLTRAGYAGVQRYAAVWTGDNRSFWEHMAMAMPMVLNMGLSGIAFSGPDVGGFAHDTTGQLLARWTQMGAFFPFFRNHSAMGTKRQEPWQFGLEIEEVCRRYIQLRQRLLPFFYSLFYETSQTGVPVMRPLVLEYPDDAIVHNLCDQFLVGRDVLVAPIYRPDTEYRAVYLPPGVWVNANDEQRLEGGRHVLVHAPLSELPLFVRGGALIPEQALNIDESGDLLLHVYVGGKSGTHGHFVFYDDDGVTFEFHSGVFDEVDFRTIESKDSVEVTVEPRHLGFKPNRTIYLRIHRPDGSLAHYKLQLSQGPQRILDRW